MELFIQNVCIRLCKLNNNGVINPETVCAAADSPPFPLVPKGHTSIEKSNVKLLCSDRMKVDFSMFTTMAKMAHFFISVTILNSEFRILNSEF